MCDCVQKGKQYFNFIYKLAFTTEQHGAQYGPLGDAARKRGSR